MRPIRIPGFRFAIPLAALLAAGCWDDDDDDVTGLPGNGIVDHAAATVRSYAGGNPSGIVRFDEDGDSLDITAAINGLLPGQAYGIHVHENGDCSTPEASGPHFREVEPHGNPFDSGGTHHRGDLPNLVADSVGVGRLVFSTDMLDLETTDRSVINRSVVLHALPDDYVSQPAGGTGDRIACGVIVFTGPGGLDTTGTGGGGDGDTTGDGDPY